MHASIRRLHDIKVGVEQSGSAFEGSRDFWEIIPLQLELGVGRSPVLLKREGGMKFQRHPTNNSELHPLNR